MTNTNTRSSSDTTDALPFTFFRVDYPISADAAHGLRPRGNAAVRHAVWNLVKGRRWAATRELARAAGAADELAEFHCAAGSPEHYERWRAIAAYRLAWYHHLRHAALSRGHQQ